MASHNHQGATFIYINTVFISINLLRGTPSFAYSDQKRHRLKQTLSYMMKQSSFLAVQADEGECLIREEFSAVCVIRSPRAVEWDVMILICHTHTLRERKSRAH